MTSAHIEERGIFSVECSDVEHHACVLAVELEEDQLDGVERGACMDSILFSYLGCWCAFVECI
jgi:hypothetical protein